MPPGKKYSRLIIKYLKEIFGHRTDAYYVYKGDGPPIPATECTRWITEDGKSKCVERKYLPLTEDVIKQHLLHKITIGILPIDKKDDTCIVFCIDVDYHEGVDPEERIEKNFMNVAKIANHLYEKYNMYLLLEKSGSKESYHIIGMFQKTSATIVRNFLFFALEIELGIPIKAGRNVRLAHGVPKTGEKISHEGVEIFPKQDKASLINKKLGYQFTMPLGLCKKKGQKKSKLLIVNHPIYLHEEQQFYEGCKEIAHALEQFIENNKNTTIPIVELPVIVEEPKPLVEDHPGEDKSFSYYLQQQLFCIQHMYYAEVKIPLTKDQKRFIARNFHLSGTPILKIRKFFMVQIGYDKEQSIEKIEQILKELIDEIYDSKAADPDDDSLTEDEKADKEKIRNDIKAGKYKHWKVSCDDKEVKGETIKGFKSTGGKILKKTICNVTCQMRKNVFNSLVKGGDYNKAKKSLLIPLFKQIWKKIDIEENRIINDKHVYVQVSLKELQKIVNDIEGKSGR